MTRKGTVDQAPISRMPSRFTATNTAQTMSTHDDRAHRSPGLSQLPGASRRDRIIPPQSVIRAMTLPAGQVQLTHYGNHRLSHTVTRRIVAWPPARHTTVSAAMTPVMARALSVAGYAPAGRSRSGATPAREHANGTAGATS